MATKPTKSTEWASDASALKIDPSADQQSYGWSTSDNTVSGVPVKPNLQNQNGWQNAVHRWKEYFEDVTDDALKWHQATASATLTAASPRKWYVQGQTSEVVLTIDGTDIKKGDLFKFKNDGPLDLSDNDRYILHVKTTDANINLVVWLMTGDNCVIRATKDAPSVTTDWEFVEIKRPNGLEYAMNFQYFSNGLADVTDGYCREFIYVDAHGRWYGIRDNGYIFYSNDQYGNSWSEVNLGMSRNDFIQYIPEHDLLLISAWSGTDYKLLSSDDKGLTWSILWSTGSNVISLKKPFYFQNLDRISVPISGANSGFLTSDDGGNTWQSTIYATTTGQALCFKDELRSRIFLYASTEGYFYFANDGFNLSSTSFSSALVYDTNNVPISLAFSGGFSVKSIFYNEYTKKFFMFFRKNSTPQYQIAHSVDGSSWYIDGSVLDQTWTIPQTATRNLALPYGSLFYSDLGYFYLATEPNNARLSNMPFVQGFETIINSLNGAGYSERMNRIIIDDDDNSTTQRFFKSGRL